MIYRFFISQFVLIRRIYKTPNRDRSTNVSVLTAFLFMINIYSTLMLLEYYHVFEFGLFDFWKPTKTPKSMIGGILGLALMIPFYSIYGLSKMTTAPEQRTAIIRSELSRKTSALLSAFYIIMTLTFLIFMFIISIDRIVNWLMKLKITIANNVYDSWSDALHFWLPSKKLNQNHKAYHEVIYVTCG